MELQRIFASRKGEQEKETMLKLLEYFSESLIDDDAVLVRQSPLAEKFWRDPTARTEHLSVVTDAGRLSKIPHQTEITMCSHISQTYLRFVSRNTTPVSSHCWGEEREGEEREGEERGGLKLAGQANPLQVHSSQKRSHSVFPFHGSIAGLSPATRPLPRGRALARLGQAPESKPTRMPRFPPHRTCLIFVFYSMLFPFWGDVLFAFALPRCSFGCVILLLADMSMFFVSCSFERGRDDRPLRVHTCIIHRDDFLPSASHATGQCWPTSIGTRSIHFSTKLAHVEHVLNRAP